uniref:Z-DNA binding protein 1 n=1 Tax=Cebus imitator TaxID=2715852 RepID=A0A2K5PCZ2_CEBIM
MAQAPADPGKEAKRPLQDTATIPESPGPQFSQREKEIYRFLKDNGPQRALCIAQGLKMRTAKDVNRDLYRMKSRHLLDLDEQSKTWRIYRPEDSGGTAESTSIIYQHNPINVICQNGPNSQISIARSDAIQIGHGNTMTWHAVSREDSSTGPCHLPPMAPGDSSIQGTLVDAWGPQDIHMERSMLRRVQLGHSNEMRLRGVPSEGPAHRPPGSPPVSATAASPEALFEERMPNPGTHPKEVAAQRIHIKSCFLEDATIGNSNKMSVSPGAADPGGAAGSGDREPGEDAGLHPADTQSRSHFPGDIGQPITHNHTNLSPKLEAMTLGKRRRKAADGSHCVDKASHSGSWGAGIE